MNIRHPNYRRWLRHRVPSYNVTVPWKVMEHYQLIQAFSQDFKSGRLILRTLIPFIFKIRCTMLGRGHFLALNQHTYTDILYEF